MFQCAVYVPSAHRIDYEWPISKDYAEEKLQYIKAYVDNLPQETQSLTTGTSDSGLRAQAGPSELEEDLKGKYQLMTLKFCPKKILSH